MTREAPPKVADEPDWMKLSTVMGLKAGGVVFRDLRAWHFLRARGFLHA